MKKYVPGNKVKFYSRAHNKIVMAQVDFSGQFNLIVVCDDPKGVSTRYSIQATQVIELI